MNLNFFQVTLMIFLIYICLYSLVNRICKCIEYCAVGKAYKEVAALTDKSTSDEEKEGSEHV